MGLTENEKKLANLLYSKHFDKYDVIFFVLALKSDKNIKTMLDWIEKYPQADNDQIFGKLYEMIGIQPPED
jgi:hypothetical protein